MISISAEEKKCFIEGPAGKIEALLQETQTHHQTTTIICHPHPLYGGTMNNKVVTTLAKTFQELGHRTIRFNFRGVGDTEGSYDQGFGESEDLLAIIAWLKTQDPTPGIALAGFSFGTYVATRVATTSPENAIKQLVCIAPAVTHFDFQALMPLHCPCLVVQGEEDEIVSPQAVYDWVNSLSPKPVLIRFPETGHFFHGKLTELKKILLENLK